MFQEILAENGTKFAVAAVVVLLGLLCLALVLWIIRGRPSSPFIRGGRNRTPRLAVLDAAAIDTRRRLVLVRRDDMEHLIMIGGPTDVVIELRIASAPAESIQTAEAMAEQPDLALERQETPVRTVETAARAEATTTAASATGSTQRHAAAGTPEGVSAMSKVLYASDEENTQRPVQTRAFTQPVETAQQAQTARQRTPERRIEDLLAQNRQRVLTPQPAGSNGGQATAGRTAQRTAALARPTPQTTDNPALVSEFEKILEAEMTANAAAAGTARNTAQTAALSGQVQTPAKSREETEAEMARLLGEIAASRKS